MKLNLNKIPVLTVAALILGMVYLWQVNTLSTLGYSVTELENKKTQLLNKQQELIIDIAQARSSESVLKRLENVEMVNKGKVTYIDVYSGMALNK